MSSYTELLKLANQAKKRVHPGPSNGSASSSKSFISGNKKLERKKPDPDAIKRLQQRIASEKPKPPPPRKESETPKNPVKKSSSEIKSKKPKTNVVDSSKKHAKSSSSSSKSRHETEPVKKRKSENGPPSSTSKKAKLSSSQSSSNNNKKKAATMSYQEMLAKAGSKDKTANLASTSKSSKSKSDRDQEIVENNSGSKEDEYLYWGLTDEEYKFFHSLNAKAAKAHNKGVQPKLDSYEKKMQERIKKKKNEYKAKMKKQAEKQSLLEKANKYMKNKPSKNLPPPKPQPAKILNPYAKQEISKGKKSKIQESQSSESPKLPKKNSSTLPNKSSSLQNSKLKNGHSRAVSNGSRGFDPYAHRRDENSYQQRSRNPYDDLPDSEDEYDSELDDFIDDEDDEVGEAVARKLVRASCKNMFTMKSGETYSSDKWAERERGLSDYALAKSMTSSNRQLMEEERIAARNARNEEKLYNQKYGVDRAVDYGSD